MHLWGAREGDGGREGTVGRGEGRERKRGRGVAVVVVRRGFYERPPTYLSVYPPYPAAVVASVTVPDPALPDKQMLDKFLFVKPVSTAA